MKRIMLEIKAFKNFITPYLFLKFLSLVRILFFKAIFCFLRSTKRGMYRQMHCFLFFCRISRRRWKLRLVFELARIVVQSTIKNQNPLFHFLSKCCWSRLLVYATAAYSTMASLFFNELAGGLPITTSNEAYNCSFMEYTIRFFTYLRY